MSTKMYTSIFCVLNDKQVNIQHDGIEFMQNSGSYVVRSRDCV